MSEPPKSPDNRIGGEAWKDRSPAPEPFDNRFARGPAPEMGMGDAIRAVLSQYATFSGRARRAEYWWWWLFTVLCSLAAGFVDSALGMNIVPGEFSSGPVSMILSLALLLPNLAVSVRRLHDTDHSGWWLLFPVVIAGIFMLFFGAIAGGGAPYDIGMPTLILIMGLCIILLIYAIVIFIWTVKISQPGTNRFGPSPLEQ
ncbi:MAG: DUF805 domain-containing protein [Paracoccus sp. (in: a-proteobacteria)]